ncbi:MAG: trimethylamine methyltransferase family protein, partial [Desulfovibrionales bacterium]|nr:trimethylamine methyltransferase family protein [Desulfovibrionales bacterium]
HVDILGTPTPRDLALETYDIHTLRHMIENSRKHMWVLTQSSQNLRYQMEIMKAVAGGAEELKKRPVCSGIVCVIDPLYMPYDEVERLMIYGETLMPVRVPIVPMTGTTAPVTIAGTVTMANAEYLGALTIIQTLCPGMPVIYYVIPKSMDMATGASIGASSTETVLFSSAVAQMARHYEVPSAISAASGTCSQPHQLMFQYGHSILMTLLSGASEISVLGHVSGSLMCSPDLAVICDEIMGYFRCMLKGFDVTPDTLAVEAMDRVGPKGQFLSDRHTMAFLRKEPRFRPGLFQWNTHDKWKEDGFKTLIERARDKAADLRTVREVPELDAAVRNELKAIVDAADKEFLS